MLSPTLSVLIAVVVGYLASSFLQVVSHRWLGHEPAAQYFLRCHVFDHHRIYAPKHLVSERYSDVERSLTPYYALLIAAVIGLLHSKLPRASLLGFSATLVASYAAHAYVHEHYHLEKSWLTRWVWFCRRRDLHYMHHRNTRCNFGVLDFYWDRLFGTFVAAGTLKRSQ